MDTIHGIPNEERTPNILATPIDLTPDAVKAVSDALNSLIADAFALYVKTKNYSARPKSASGCSMRSAQLNRRF